ncbi:capsule polysaccharide biosynthesis protein [Phlyctema vagabunda]|uniref:Capsule polysaccharide biosynthesis protein n=1 Tax=Phlyctema vagabunda TaxID=108571 RepID=A0ABR4PMJ9_9HELO
MASATRLPLKSLTFTALVLIGAGASRVNLRNVLVNTFTGPGSYSRIVAIAVVLANVKNFPWAWHYRVFQGILKHCLFSIPQFPATTSKPSTLFLPVITTSHSPFTECDYNLHKSNSTYFSDLDVTRSHLVCCLLQPGIDKLHKNQKHKLVLDKEGKAVKGAWGIMLGAVACSFKREIKPFERYEMWSRLLCWDRKWIYVVTHFVKAGTVRPESYILGDGSWFGTKYGLKKGAKSAKDGAEDVDQKFVFATAISKYVVKLGRLTVHPEVLIEAAGMLPSRPGGWTSMSSLSAANEPKPELEFLSRENGSVDGSITGAENGTANGHANGNANGSATSADKWDWERVEAQNERGLKFAEHFAALDGLHGEFAGSKQPALGRYRDFLL